MTISRENHANFLNLAGLLIPDGPESPSASTVLLEEGLVVRALAARPDLEPLVNAAVAKASEVRSLEELEEVLGFPSEEFNALTLIVAGAYYLSSPVLETLDYDPPAERYVNGSLEQDLIDMLPMVKCTPRFTP